MEGELKINASSYFSIKANRGFTEQML